MNKLRETLAPTSATLLLLLMVAVPAASELVRTDEATSIAERWVESVVESRGSWGGATDPTVGELVELEYDGRVVGYYFPVEPRGQVVVSLVRGLAPIKSYSESSRFDPRAPDGPSDLLRGQMSRIIEGVESVAGPLESIEPDVLAQHLEIDYRWAWDVLAEGTIALPTPDREAGRGDYAEGDTLIATQWDQEPPYNADCPDSGCFYSSQPGYNTNALVGCVATAAAQIMHHWSWPPYGSGSPYSDAYDWPNMYIDAFYSITDDCFKDGQDTTWVCLTEQQIDAVAELCAEVGQAVNMDYGCELSSAFTAELEGVFEDHYRYSTASNYIHRGDYTAMEWFMMIQAQCYGNRPMVYRVLGHAFVCDGWRDSGGFPEYHMNYGWDNAYNGWYVLDALHYPAGGSTDDEAMLRGIYPAPSLVTAFSGTYTVPDPPYRYFDRDGVGDSATFDAGHNLQFLPGVVVGCQSGHVTINGSASAVTRLFARGDLTKGAEIGGGAVKISVGGEITIP